MIHKQAPGYALGMRKLALEFACWMAIAMLVLGPGLWTDIHSVPGGQWTDVWNSMWSMQFASDSLWAGSLPWFTDALNHPHGGSVLLPDALGSLFAAFAVPTLGLALAYTAWIALQLALSGWVMQRFAQHWLRESLDEEHATRAGWVAGLAYCSAPVLLAGVACGTTEAVAGAPPVLAAWAAWHALKHPGFRTTLLAGLAFFVAGVASWYAVVIAAVFVGVLTLKYTPTLGLRAWAPLATGLALVVPLALWTHGIHTDADHLATRDPAILDRIRATFGAASLLGMAWPIDQANIAIQHPDDTGQGYLHTGYIGIALLVGSAVAAVRNPRRALPWLIAGIACAVLAMGPGAEANRPYALVDGLPGFRNLSLVWRLAGGASIAAALLAASATGGKTRSCWALAVAIAIEWAALAPTAGGVATSDASPPAILQQLADRPAGAVITVPASDAHADLWRQTHHRQPITATINSRRSAAADAWASAAGDADWSTVQSSAQEAGIRYVLLRQSRSLRASTDRFLAQTLQKNAEIVGTDGRWTAYAVW